MAASPQRAGLRHRLTRHALMSGGAGGGTPVAVQGEDIAFIQYTSGSNGNPKGVPLKHAKLLDSMRAMALAIGATPRDVFVS